MRGTKFPAETDRCGQAPTGARRRPAPPTAKWLVPRAAAAAVAAAVAAGCASAPPPPPAAPPSPPPAAPAEPAPAPAAAAPWEIPAELLASQRLYRVRYQGPEGEGGLRLTLWLATAERYRARAVDQLGRPLWSLSFDREGGLWIDHRAEVFCRLRGHADLTGLAGLSLAPFPLAALPPLLLGRLPARPAPGGEPALGGEAIDYRDAEGRRWTATLDGGGVPASWALWGESDAGGPLLTWLAAGGEAVLSDRAAGMQLRWRQVVAEALAGTLGLEEPPAGYREATCPEAAAAAGGRRFDSFPPRL
jgi:hypothetical protein